MTWRINTKSGCKSQFDSYLYDEVKFANEIGQWIPFVSSVSHSILSHIHLKLAFSIFCELWISNAWLGSFSDFHPISFQTCTVKQRIFRHTHICTHLKIYKAQQQIENARDGALFTKEIWTFMTRDISQMILFLIWTCKSSHDAHYVQLAIMNSFLWMLIGSLWPCYISCID